MRADVTGRNVFEARKKHVQRSIYSMFIAMILQTKLKQWIAK